MGERVRIKFGDFDIEDSDSCHFNYLRIYNGIGVSRTEIGKYCGLGLQMNHSIESKGNEITLLFMSGIHVSGRGFLASYSVIDKQGNFHLMQWLLQFVISNNKNKMLFL
ncbi:DCBLD2 isoform 3, partial [Pongo abelii]